MRYRLRTLVFLTAIGPPILAVAWWLDMAPIAIGIAIWAVAAIALCS